MQWMACSGLLCLAVPYHTPLCVAVPAFFPVDFLREFCQVQSVHARKAVPGFTQGKACSCVLWLLVFGLPREFNFPVPSISGGRSPIRHLGKRSMGEQ